MNRQKQQMAQLAAEARQCASDDAKIWFSKEWVPGTAIPEGENIPIDKQKYAKHIKNDLFLKLYRQTWTATIKESVDKGQKPGRTYGAKSPSSSQPDSMVRPPMRIPQIPPSPPLQPQMPMRQMQPDAVDDSITTWGQPTVTPIGRPQMQIPDEEDTTTKLAPIDDKKGGLLGKGKKKSPASAAKPPRREDIVDHVPSRAKNINKRAKIETEGKYVGTLVSYTIVLCSLVGGFGIQFFLMELNGIFIHSIFSLFFMYLVIGIVLWKNEMKAHPFLLTFQLLSTLAVMGFLAVTYGHLYKKFYGFPVYMGLAFALLPIAIGGIWIMKKLK